MTTPTTMSPRPTVPAVPTPPMMPISPTPPMMPISPTPPMMPISPTPPIKPIMPITPTISPPTTLICKHCGQELPEESFELYPTGTRRRVCRRCHYELHTKRGYQQWKMRQLTRSLINQYRRPPSVTSPPCPRIDRPIPPPAVSNQPAAPPH